MNLLNKHFWKFFFVLLVMIAAGLSVAYGTNFYSDYKRFNAERERQEAQRAEAERMQKLYEEDTYGGKTPEETLALFIDALKKGDTDLAAKYFVIEGREGFSVDLKNTELSGNLNKAIERALSLTPSKIDGNRASFIIADKNNVIQYQIILGKGQNGTWKIIDL